jgi:hypothetical protein
VPRGRRSPGPPIDRATAGASWGIPLRWELAVGRRRVKDGVWLWAIGSALAADRGYTPHRLSTTLSAFQRRQ